MLEVKEDRWLGDNYAKVRWMRRVYPRVDYTQAPWTVVMLRQPSQGIHFKGGIDVSPSVPHSICLFVGSSPWWRHSRSGIIIYNNNMYYSMVMFGGSAWRLIPCSGFVFTAYATVYYVPYLMMYCTVLPWYLVSVLFLLFVWCPCMATNVSVQYNGGLFPDIIPLTKCYYHRGTPLNAMKRFCICCL